MAPARLKIKTIFRLRILMMQMIRRRITFDLSLRVAPTRLGMITPEPRSLLPPSPVRQLGKDALSRRVDQSGSPGRRWRAYSAAWR